MASQSSVETQKSINSLPKQWCAVFSLLASVAMMPTECSAQVDDGTKDCFYIFLWDVGNFVLTESYQETIPSESECIPPSISTFTGSGIEANTFGAGRRVIPYELSFLGINLNDPNATLNENSERGSFVNDGHVAVLDFEAMIGRDLFRNVDRWEFLDDSSVGVESPDATPTNGPPLFSNASTGRFWKSGGGGISGVNIDFQDSGGAVGATSGSLRFRRSTSFQGTEFFGSGRIQFGGETSFGGSSNVTSDTTLELIGNGTVTGTFAGDAQNPTPVRMSFFDGAIQGDFINQGEINLRPSNDPETVTRINDNSTFTNGSLGTVLIDGDGFVLTEGGGGLFSGRFDNRGVFRKSGGTGTTFVGDVTFSDTDGQVIAETGVLEFNTGSVTLNGTRFGGPGTVRLNTEVLFTDELDAGTTNLELAGGVFRGDSDTTEGTNGQVLWTGGTFEGQVGNFGTLTIQAESTPEAVQTRIARLARLRNNTGGVIQAVEDGNILTGVGSSSGILDNRGVFRKSGGTGTTFVGDVTFSDTDGQVIAETGVLEFNTGSVTLNGTRFGGPGTVRLNTEVLFTDELDAGTTNLELAGGVFRGDSDTTEGTNGQVLWTGGTFEGQVGNFGTLTIQAESTPEAVQTRIARLARLRNNTGGVIQAVEDGNILTGVGSSSGILDNRGVFRKSGGTGTTFVGDVTFSDTDGQVIAETGVLEFNTGSVTLNGTRFGGPGTVRLNTEVLFTDELDAGTTNLELAGGVFRGDSDTTEGTNGQVLWTGGTFEGQVGNFGTLTIQAESTPEAVQTRIARLARLRNNTGGVIQAVEDGNILTGVGSSSGILDNRGVFRKSGGTGTTFVGDVTFSDTDGQVIAETGVLEFNTGSVTLNGTRFGGPGTVRLNTEVLFTDELDAGTTNLELAGGVFRGDSDTTEGTNGQVLWTGGTFEGQVGNFGTLTIQAESTPEAVQTRIARLARLRNNASGGGEDGTEAGVVQFVTDGYALTNDGSSSGVLDNRGVFRKSGGTGTTFVGDVTFSDTDGQVIAETGVLEFNTGSVTLNGTRFGGPGTVRLNTEVLFTDELDAGTTNLELAGGVFRGDSDTTEGTNGQVLWTGGTFEGQVGNFGTLTIQAESTPEAVQTRIARLARLRNNTGGVIQAVEDGNILTGVGSSSGILDNRGVFRKSGGTGTTFVGDVTFSDTDGQVIAETGVLEFNTGSVTLNGTRFGGPGTVRLNTEVLFTDELDAGTTNLELAGGVFRGDSDTTEGTNGQVLWTGGTFEGQVGNFGTLTIQAESTPEAVQTRIARLARLRNNASGGGEDGTEAGVVQFVTDGYALTNDGSSSGVLDNRGVFRKSGGTGTTFVGDVTFSDTDGQVIAETGVLEFNTGSVTLNGTRFGGPGTVRLNTEVLFTDELDAGTTNLELAGGVFRGDSDTTEGTNGQVLWTGGTFEGQVGNFGTLVVGGSDSGIVRKIGRGATLNNQGVLAGQGVIDTTDGLLTSSGTIAPGNPSSLLSGNSSIGKLRINGNLRSTGTIQIEVAPDSQDSDELVVTRTLTLGGGTLDIVGASLPLGSHEIDVLYANEISAGFELSGDFEQVISSDTPWISIVSSQIVDDATDLGEGEFLYDAYRVSLVVSETGVAGDYNNDGVVDAADYTVWRDNLDSSADLANDSTVGVTRADYEVWRTNYGRSFVVVSAFGASVPEPSSLFLLLTMAILTRGSRPDFKRCVV